MGLDKLKVQINSVLMKQNEHEFSALLRRWEKVVDGINVLPAQEFGEVEDIAVPALHIKGKRGVGKFPFGLCFGSLCEGTAGVCCGDSNGALKVVDFKTQTIDEVWNGIPLQRICDIHIKREFNKFSVCKDCHFTYTFSYLVRCYIQAHLFKLRW